jgi:hypothetical protein
LEYANEVTQIRKAGSKTSFSNTSTVQLIKVGSILG